MPVYLTSRQAFLVHNNSQYFFIIHYQTIIVLYLNLWIMTANSAIIIAEIASVYRNFSPFLITNCRNKIVFTIGIKMVLKLIPIQIGVFVYKSF